VTELTGRAGAPAFVFAATVLPVFAASPVAGALADRLDRRRILVIADLARVPLALALCAAAHWRSTPLAFAAVTALAIGASFSDPVASGRDPEPGRRCRPRVCAVADGRGVGLDADGRRRIGGLVADLFGRQAAFVIDATSFLASAWLIAGIRRPMQQAVGRRDAGSMRDALDYIRSTPVVLRLVCAKGGVSSANGIVGLLPAFAASRFASTSIATGLLFAARGLGAMMGPLVARRVIGATPGRRAIVAVCGASTLTYCAVYAVFPLTHAFTAALILVMCAHLGGGAQWSLSTYGLQRETPDHFRGRVLSLDYGLATL